MTGRLLVLDAGAACNNRCLTCASPEFRSGQGGPAPYLQRLQETVAAARAAGARELRITGGEPTLNPHLPAVSEYAKSLGFKPITLQTNARLFCYPDRARRAVDAGITRFEVMLHGHTAELHDHLTGTPRSFLQSLAGLRNLGKAGATVGGGIVLARPNYRHLAEIIRLLARLGGRFINFYAPSLPPAEWEAKSAVIPRLSLALPYLKSALAAARAAGLEADAGGFPPCLLPGSRSLAEARYPCAWNPERPALGPACASCARFQDCPGPAEGYARRFGWDEFSPIPKPEPNRAAPAARMPDHARS